jgi:aminopeptidase-like protein
LSASVLSGEERVLHDASEQLQGLRDETYEAVIDSSLEDGYLTYGEYLHKGETDDEFLASAHVCHPSLGPKSGTGAVRDHYGHHGGDRLRLR